MGYKTPVPTSQETHYVSATEPSRLMLCKFCGFNCGDYEESSIPCSKVMETLTVSLILQYFAKGHL
jgi:hypothetical protein